ncbi:hypothetical protein BXY57_2307 [Thermoflavifilum aggregans]|uniref:Cytochrome b561-like protein n=1 Tax=Thermoflavifilum aggregans TaxID=454188 RepID=A0A2M9CXS7_9BACT|nr:hypothetical protein [Thermoflavifilum aggregans]PJJ76675.1 hypothetical protein BXY57_2307 [Thermoflavifilum aggregans]
MHTFFLILHNWMRWVVILLGLWAWFSAFAQFTGDKKYLPVHRRSGLLFMISCDLQLLIGIILYIVGGWLSQWSDMSQTMQQAAARFFTVEHETLMIIAWILVHVGWSRVKKAQSDRQKLSRSLIFFGIALLLILIAIPWPFREVARPWLRT